MSGTSLDGISSAVVRFRRARRTRAGSAAIDCDLLAHRVHAYAISERRRLERAISDGASADEWCELGFALGASLAEAAEEVLAQSGVARSRVRAIASHGQTIWHVPGRSTWQIGESAVIAERTGIDVVSDFRVRDVAAGGQGAPLVSMADSVLFPARESWRALQNLGGIANVTVVPPRIRPRRQRGAAAGAATEVRAFDTGPGVVVVDAVVRALRPALSFDVDGTLARQGRAITRVVDKLLRDPYFALTPPKSTGREHFGTEYVTAFLAQCRGAAPSSTDADLVATAVSLTARSIADAYGRFVHEPVRDVLVSGGGARNPALVDALGAALAPRTVRRFDTVFFDGEAKEAVAFALLAALHLAGQPGNVPSATGASGPRVLGKLTPAALARRRQ